MTRDLANDTVRFSTVILVSVLTIASLPVASRAQQTSDKPAGQQADQSNSSSSQQKKSQVPGPVQAPNPNLGQKHPHEEANIPGTSNDRLFYTLPNFLTLENAGKVPPLTTKEKFDVVSRESLDYVVYPWYAFLAGVSQAQDSEPGYGQGGAAYGKRFGAAFADGTIESYITGAILPSLLKQDPRYFQLGHGGIWPRAWYSMTRNLVTRTDSGKEQFNYSEVVGGALSASISTYSYHPKSHLFPTTTPGVYRFIPSDRTLPNTVKVWGTQYGYDTLTLVAKEFWPDIRRKLRHKPKEFAVETGTTHRRSDEPSTPHQ